MAAPAGSQAIRRETRADHEGTQESPFAQDSRQHHPVRKLQKKTTGDYDGRQGLAISQDPQQAHPVLGLREGKQEEIYDRKQGLAVYLATLGSTLSSFKKGDKTELMMGDQDWPFPGTPGGTIRFSSYKKGENKRL